MYNKLDSHIFVIQALVYNNKKVTGEINLNNDEIKKKLNKHESYLDEIKTTLKQVIVQNKAYFLENMDSPKPQDTTTVVPANKKAQPLEIGHSTKIDGMWNLKYEISSQTFYEILIKTELKGNNGMDLKKF